MKWIGLLVATAVIGCCFASTVDARERIITRSVSVGYAQRANMHAVQAPQSTFEQTQYAAPMLTPTETITRTIHRARFNYVAVPAVPQQYGNAYYGATNVAASTGSQCTCVNCQCPDCKGSALNGRYDKRYPPSNVPPPSGP